MLILYILSLSSLSLSILSTLERNRKERKILNLSLYRTWTRGQIRKCLFYMGFSRLVGTPVENVHKWTNAATAAATNLPTVGGAGPSNSSLSCRRTGVRGLAYAGGSLVDRRAVLPGLGRADCRASDRRARRACRRRVGGYQAGGGAPGAIGGPRGGLSAADGLWGHPPGV